MRNGEVGTRKFWMVLSVWLALSWGAVGAWAAPADSQATAAPAASASGRKSAVPAPPAAAPSDKSKPAKPDNKKASATKPPPPPAAAKKPAAQSPPPATPTAAAPGSAAPKGTDSDYRIRLRDLESRVDELKERIRASHTRLSLLSDTILSGGLGGAHAEIVFRNELGNAFRITSLLFVMDGAVQYKKEDATGVLSTQKLIPIFSGPVPPGDHTLQVVVGMRGHGYGVFSYLKAYKPKAKRTHSFTVDEGKSAKVEVVLWEKGSATTPVEQRPALRFVQKVRDRSEALTDDEVK